jgi:mannose-6-phosphate isomerase-like protein (cupin superfamily)
MADYKHVNLQEIEDTSMGGGDAVQGRFARKFLESRDLGVSLWTYEAGVQLPTHHHGEQEEAYVVVEGSGRMLLDDDVIDVREWDVVRVAPDVDRAFEAGPQGLTVIAIGGPKPEGGDGARGTAEWPAD